MFCGSCNKLVTKAGCWRSHSLNHILDPISWCRQGRDFVAFRNTQLKQTQNYLRKIESQLGSAGINVRSDLSEGSMPASYIVKYAKDHDVDFIIIAGHGDTGMKKLMFGSVALEKKVL